MILIFRGSTRRRERGGEEVQGEVREWLGMGQQQKSVQHPNQMDAMKSEHRKLKGATSTADYYHTRIAAADSPTST